MVLSLAEGEGRNAVFLALQGYSVIAVDPSQVDLNKARKLAEEKGVILEFIHADLVDYDLGEKQWDGIVSIFCSLPSTIRKALYKKVMAGLKQNGVFLLEAYTPEKLKYGTGDDNSVDTMQSETTLRLDTVYSVDYGVYHFD